MKKINDILISAANDLAPAATFEVSGGELRVPFGDFPQTVVLTGQAAEQARRAGVAVPASGRVTVIQRVDAVAANALAADLSSLMGRVKRFFLGAPIYNGHPFHPDREQRKHYPDKRAYGLIKEVKVEDDALVLVGAYNSLGKEAVQDGQLLFHSPEWNMRFEGVEGGAAIYRPVSLRSTGLTNDPNIPVPPVRAANEKAGLASVDQIDESFVAEAVKLLDAGRGADFEALAVAVNEALSGDDAGFMERLETLRGKLPELVSGLKASTGEVEALEAILGAAAANGLAEAAADQDSSDDDNNEQDNDMLKKLLELLAAAGLIQATDPEETVLVKLAQLKEEMNWKREELARQKAEAERIKATLPAANVADLADAGEDVPLLSAELVTATANTIAELREENTRLTAARQELHEALAEAALERLTAANAITGAEVETARATLLAANDRAAFDEAVQELCKGGASTAQRETEGLAGGAQKVAAANDAAAQAEERRALVLKHQTRLAGGGKPTQRHYDAAWDAARKERPDLF